jgi:hypothetical protein
MSMIDKERLKDFVMNFPAEPSSITEDFASKVINEAVACADARAGRGGGFSIDGRVGRILIDNMPTLEFMGRANGSGFAIILSGQVSIFPDGSTQLHMIFHDYHGWRVQESEEQVAYTLACLDEALNRFIGARKPQWCQMVGQWKHL